MVYDEGLMALLPVTGLFNIIQRLLKVRGTKYELRTYFVFRTSYLAKFFSNLEVIGIALHDFAYLSNRNEQEGDTIP